MAESEPELPVEPVIVTEVQEVKPAQPARSNMGVIVLSVGLVVVCMAIIYFVFIDKKMGKSSTRMNNNSMMGKSSTRMNNNSMMPNVNSAPQALNSINMSSNGGYGYKANAF